MSKKEFEDFLNMENKKMEDGKIDWNERKKEWVGYIESMYSNVTEWLRDYINNGQIKIKYRDIELHEEPIGAYKTREMEISINDKIATLTPMGTILIGTRGRIDLSGRYGSVKMILAIKEANSAEVRVTVFTSEKELQDNAEENKRKIKVPIELVWKIATDPPIIKYTDLNLDSFLDILMMVINGKKSR